MTTEGNRHPCDDMTPGSRYRLTFDCTYNGSGLYTENGDYDLEHAATYAQTIEPIEETQ